eukprot:4730395-Pleurochrysis_carterae.AAC.1
MGSRFICRAISTRPSPVQSTACRSYGLRDISSSTARPDAESERLYTCSVGPCTSSHHDSAPKPLNVWFGVVQLAVFGHKLVNRSRGLTPLRASGSAVGRAPSATIEARLCACRQAPLAALQMIDILNATQVLPSKHAAEERSVSLTSCTSLQLSTASGVRVTATVPFDQRSVAMPATPAAMRRS